MEKIRNTKSSVEVSEYRNKTKNSSFVLRDSNFQQTGQAFVVILLVMGLIVISVVLLITNSLTFFQSTKYDVDKAQAINLAEAGIDRAVAALNTTGGTYNGEAETVLGDGSFSVVVTPIDSSTISLTSTGYIPNKANPTATETIKIQVSKGVGASFAYGMQVGNGGIDMGNTSQINGSIYSNGNFTGGNSNIVTGDVFVAGGTQPTANQESDCEEPNCTDYEFGRLSGTNPLDVAQSFQPTETQVLNKVSLKLKKVGSPSNATVRILGNSGSNPNKNNVLATGTLNASLATSSYSFVEVTFSSTPTLTANTTYWIVIDTSANASNYWHWSNNSLSGYTRGAPKWSPNWNAGSPVWNNITGDLGFKAFMGGVATYIEMSNSSRVNGSVHANTIDGSSFTIGQNAYYQTISGTTVNGSSFPGSEDPPPLPLPISDANIADWKTQAQEAAIYTGNITNCPQSLGPGKYVGNFTAGNNCTITITTPVWITGNFTAGNSLVFNLNPSSGSYSGMVIVDGLTDLGNTSSFNGSGTSGSYMLFLTTYDSRSNGIPAIDPGNGAVSGIVYAPYGLINLPNGALLHELVAYQINMGNGTILNYQTGLSNIFFSSGPTGAFSVIKGTYQLK